VKDKTEICALGSWRSEGQEDVASPIKYDEEDSFENGDMSRRFSDLP
jgi:hypothetical protein